MIAVNVGSYGQSVASAPMGGPQGSWAVVDPRGAVKSIGGLRVVGASVMPIVPSLAINVTTTMLVDAELTTADRNAERATAIAMRARLPATSRRRTVAGDKGYDTPGSSRTCAVPGSSPHIAQDTARPRRPAHLTGHVAGSPERRTTDRTKRPDRANQQNKSSAHVLRPCFQHPASDSAQWNVFVRRRGLRGYWMRGAIGERTI